MKQIFRLVHAVARQRAIQAVQNAPEGFVIEVKEPTRNLEQNAKFHALCTDLARSGLKWAGRTRNLNEWKVLLVSGHAVATDKPAEIVPGLEGEFVNLRESTASMSKSRSSSLIEYAIAFCESQGVELTDRPALEAA